MTGKWVRRVRHHECRTPSSMRTGVGSLWRCRCGQLWRCTGNSTGPDYIRRIWWRPVDDDEGAS